ncbi:hypothetical protein [Pseudomonas mangiferae]|uniref:Uncharacterized protein n=1 Tax=Pseudomonas mangiferae TaxID=2593654 RepID=A0A553H2E8_9PSED|nr:hypothetical protein [Pseudomonas mangiferae]TRX75922.1 hypothetical protein FM069_05660 [Pseudomonas mangiferae]
MKRTLTALLISGLLAAPAFADSTGPTNPVPPSDPAAPTSPIGVNGQGTSPDNVGNKPATEVGRGTGRSTGTATGDGTTGEATGTGKATQEDTGKSGTTKGQ